MLSGVMLLWFSLTAAALAFVAIDILRTPESPTLKWGFILLTAYTGPFGAFLYVLGCREPLPGLHERYVAVRWRQVLGSAIHCVAGDGVGILAGATIASFLALPRATDVALEYCLGFGFGWTIFQALFMRDMVGGSYLRSLKATFVPEFLSMNFLMSGMVPVAALGRVFLAGRWSPVEPVFWFVMSVALLAGLVVAYPINWWLVSNGLKHGMMTVRTHQDGLALHSGAQHHETVPSGVSSPAQIASTHRHDTMHGPQPSRARIAGTGLLSLALFGLGIWLAVEVVGVG